MKLNLDFELTKTDILLRKFEEIHNFIYANDGLSTQQTLEEFIKILFIKVIDEKKKEKQFYIDDAEFEQIKSSNIQQVLPVAEFFNVNQLKVVGLIAAVFTIAALGFMFQMLN